MTHNLTIQLPPTPATVTGSRPISAMMEQDVFIDNQDAIDLEDTTTEIGS